DLTKEYKKNVLEYTSHEYLSGRTPNPCVRCNCRVKFGALLRKAQDSGLKFDYFATGHYAQTEYDKRRQRYLLKKARDITKDQSYFLSSLSQEQLIHTLFPLGTYTKPEAREMARTFGLEMKDKKESQDFIAGGYYSLIEEATRTGPIIDVQDNVLGQHRGIPFYTIGQRKGLGLSSSEPLYVTAINREENSITVGPKSELYQNELTVDEVNWIAIPLLPEPVRAKVKIRYRHQEADALIAPLPEDKVNVLFDEPQMAITPGQTAVFYDGDIVLGGGTIKNIKQHSN
ncbi:MAG: tRNA 2-thiouridine(34) synthase MnmA, partial [Dehalococcoidia bacterium]|nr:tRNA 2-thiouridine(34) synthase MnmA [Dehalococcoidia bacterium]